LARRQLDLTRATARRKSPKANRPARCAGKCRKWLPAASGSTATILPKWPHSSLPPTSEHKCRPKPQQSRLAQIHRDKVKQSRLRPIAMAAFEVTTEALAGTGLTARYKSHHLAGGGSSLWSPLAVIRFYIRGENDRCHPLHSTPTGGSFPALPYLPCRVPRTVPNASSQGKDAKGSKMVASRKFINLFDILGLIMVGPEGFEPPTKGL
jgi:hypothetical protein